MTAQDIDFRPAEPSEAGDVAEIARISRRHFLPFLPKLHSLEGDRKFYRNRVFPECQVWVAEYQRELVGFCAFKPDWLEHLYLLPPYVGHGIGEVLLDKAKDSHGFLQLWCFQKNTRARRFYENNGFRLVKETDGAANEEKTPDALYVWERQ